MKIELLEKLTCSPLSSETWNRGRIFDSGSLNTSILYKVHTLGSNQIIMTLLWDWCYWNKEHQRSIEKEKLNEYTVEYWSHFTCYWSKLPYCSITFRPNIVLVLKQFGVPNNPSWKEKKIQHKYNSNQNPHQQIGYINSNRVRNKQINELPDLKKKTYH